MVNNMDNSKQLLYLWINNDENKCFEDSEFNFNPKYKFHFNKNERCLELTKQSNVINIFDTKNVVCNITAIVGDNGVGKTTIFKRIFNLPKYSIEIVKGHKDVRYLNHSRNEKNNSYYICAFLIEDRIEIINNYDGPIMFDDHQVDLYRKKSGGHVFDDTAKLYISFSSFSANGFSDKRNECFYLSPNSINEYGRSYFDRVFKWLDIKALEESVISLARSSFSLEEILIAMEIANGRGKNDNYHIRNNVAFKVLNLLGAINNDETIERDDKKYIFESLAVKDRIIDEDNFLSLIKINFLIELVSTGCINFSSRLVPVLPDETIWKKAKQFVDSLDDSKTKKYFSKGIKEIEILERIQHTFSNNFLPVTDLARYVEMILPIESAKALFETMTNDDVPSFLLKYLRFNVGMSSGEANYLRLFAFTDFALKIDHENGLTDIKNKNILLLLDEPDASLHPQAKVEFIKNLITFSNKAFAGNNVQVLLSTHSPILLSDIPNGNIIYLKRKGSKKTQVYSSSSKTFGSPISSLYSDSFFFNERLPIGAFSRDYINKLYVDIKEKRIDDIDEIRAKVEIIGDDLVKKQFYRLLPCLKKQQETDNYGELKKELERIYLLLKKVTRND